MLKLIVLIAVLFSVAFSEPEERFLPGLFGGGRPLLSGLGSSGGGGLLGGLGNNGGGGGLLGTISGLTNTLGLSGNRPSLSGVGSSYGSNSYDSGYGSSGYGSSSSPFRDSHGTYSGSYRGNSYGNSGSYRGNSYGNSGSYRGNSYGGGGSYGSERRACRSGARSPRPATSSRCPTLPASSPGARTLWRWPQMARR